MNYYLYQPLSFGVRSDIKKSCPHFGFDYKSQPWQKTYGEFLKRGYIRADISTPVIFYEYAWFKNPICYIPEDSSFIQKIASVNFEGQVKSLYVKDRFFSIAIPKDAEFNQEKIEGIFVAYCSIPLMNHYFNQFSREYDSPVRLQHSEKTDERLCISYKDPVGEGRIVLTLQQWQLEWVLEAKSVEEYRALTKRRDADGLLFYDMSSDESKTQFEVLRFVVSLIIYMSAHPDTITSIDSIKMNGADHKSQKFHPYKLKSLFCDSKKKPHYRNLQDERFYKNEWASWPRGSRWVPVNMNAELVENDK